MVFSSKVLMVSEIFLFTLVLNLFFGYFRGKQKKFSFKWFLYIHLPIPMVVLARLFSHLDFRYIPIFLLAAIAGQIFGSRLEFWSVLSAILKSPGTIELHDVAVPEPAEGELLVKVKSALTCGTDLKAYLRGHSLIPFTPRDVKKAFHLLRDNIIDVKQLLTGTCPLKEMPSVFPLLAKGKGIKYAVLP